ncbi:MAG: hypothetical protein UH239_02755 [Acutalibacteraceae bacterium]|nr:hypothetical protein [Acutalibacteraceae bacterium]
MKKFLAIIFSAILVVSAIAISGCGCNKDESGVSNTPDTDIVGNWGERSDDIEVEFNDDGTCTIGGINGTYEIDDKNRLTVTPNTEEGSNESAEPLVFEYYNGDGNFSSIPQNQWAISDNKLYINGYQYSKEDTNSSSADNTSSNNTNTSSNTNNSSSNQSSNTASNSSSSSKPSANNSSNNSAESKPNSNSNNSSSSTNKPDSSSSNTGSSSDSNSNSSASVQIEEGEEGAVFNIYENLDNF